VPNKQFFIFSSFFLDKKAQSSIEVLVIFAMMLVIFLIIYPISIGVSDSVETRLRLQTTRNALDEIAGNAKMVYNEGDGAKSNIYVKLPREIMETEVLADYIYITLSTSSGGKTVFKSFPFEVVGELPESEGLINISIEARRDFVMIGLALIKLNYGDNYSILQGAEEEDFLEFINLRDETVEVELGYTGEEILVEFGDEKFNLSDSQLESVEINYTVPLASPVGTYSGNIYAECTENNSLISRNYTYPVSIVVL